MRTGSQSVQRSGLPGAGPRPWRLRRRCRGDSGAVMAEAALVTPVFIFLVFGILEFGGSFRDYLTLNNGTQTGARRASIAANANDADWQILTTINREMAAMPQSQIQRIVVFHANGPTSAVPSACLSGSSGSPGSGTPLWTNACNVYVTPTWNTWVATDFGCGTVIPSPDRFWCPASRKYAATGTNGPPDYVGIYIQIKHKFITGLFGPDQTMNKSSIIQIEPQTLGVAG